MKQMPGIQSVTYYYLGIDFSQSVDSLIWRCIEKLIPYHTAYLPCRRR